MSEDCLQLTVIAPHGVAGTKAKLPVLVWIYGGGFIAGTGSMYSTPFLPRYGLATGRPFLLVPINYRLGIFGWGNGAEIAANKAANLGLRDQIVALQWVRDNIAAFGGDPKKVTVFGESAGAISIACLMLNSTIDLFSGAIMQSGAQSTSPLGPTGEFWQGPYDMVANLAGCKNASTPLTAAGNQSTFDCLKDVPATKLLAAQTQTKANLVYALPFVWGPSVDGDLVPDAPWKLIRDGKFAQHIPFISGNTKDEGTGFVPTYINTTLIPAVTLVNMLYPSPLPVNVSNAVLQSYPNDPSLGCPYGSGNQTFGLDPGWKQVTSVITDAAFISRRRWFMRHANHFGQRKTWAYEWNAAAPGDPAYLGASHGRDVLYTFGAVSIGQNYTAGEVALSTAMGNYWLNFGYYRDPNGKNIKKGKGKGVGAAVASLNSTYWAPHTYPSNRNSLYMSPTNVSMIQDSFREVQMSVFYQQNVSEAIHFKV